MSEYLAERILAELQLTQRTFTSMDAALERVKQLAIAALRDARRQHNPEHVDVTSLDDEPGTCRLLDLRTGEVSTIPAPEITVDA